MLTKREQKYVKSVRLNSRAKELFYEIDQAERVVKSDLDVENVMLSVLHALSPGSETEGFEKSSDNRVGFDCFYQARIVAEWGSKRLAGKTIVIGVIDGVAQRVYIRD